MAGTRRSLCRVQLSVLQVWTTGFVRAQLSTLRVWTTGFMGAQLSTLRVWTMGSVRPGCPVLRPEDHGVSWGPGIVCGGGGGSLASSSSRGQVSFLPPDSTTTCPFSERRSGCSVVVCHFPEPLTSCFLLYQSGGRNSSSSRRAGGRHSVCWKDFSDMTLHLPSLQPGLATSRRQVTVSP